MCLASFLNIMSVCLLIVLLTDLHLFLLGNALYVEMRLVHQRVDFMVGIPVFKKVDSTYNPKSNA